MKQVFASEALEAVLAGAQRPPSNEDSRNDRSPLLGGLRRSFVTSRAATPSAFERRCIPPGGVAPPSNTPGILGRRALPAGRIAALGATMDLHHGLQGPMAQPGRARVDHQPL